MASTAHIAFIRGINGGLTLKMIDLQQLFVDLGFQNIQTVLATGNVIFDAPGIDSKDIAKRIEDAIQRTYDYKTIVILYSPARLHALVQANPFKDYTLTPQATGQVSLTVDRAPAAALPFALPYENSTKGYTILCSIDTALCSLMDISGKTRPDLLAVLDRALDGKVTTRNWQTILRCHKAMEARG